MLTTQELARLEQARRGQKALSVYLDGAPADLPGQPPRRYELDQLVRRQRDALGDAPREERAAFEACVARLRDRLAALEGAEGAEGAPGWVGFFPAAGDDHVEALPARTPTLVAWGDGARIAPYVRALKQHRPAIVVTADARAATIRLYARGALEIVDRLHATPGHEGPPHMGYPPRAGFHTGTRGGTGADDEDRERRTAYARMRRELVHRVEALAGSRAWIFVAGTGRVVAGIIDALPERLRGRARRLAGVDAHAGEARLRLAAEQAASAASREHDLERVTALLEASMAGGRGVAGARATFAALRAWAVEGLYFSSTFLQRHPARAEALLRLALAQAADVEHVAGAAADRLDASGGVGAALRFQPARRGSAVVGVEGVTPAPLAGTG